MAIHDKFEVRVFVKGNPVHEYDASESCTDSLENGQTAHRTTGPVIGKCIEAVPGENFAIKLKTDRGIELKPRQALNFVVEVDGKFADGTIALKKNYDGGCGWMDTLTGVSHCVRGRWQLRKFRFQSLQTDTGPSTEKLDADEVAKIGSIQIIVRRVRVIKQEAPEPEEDDEGISSIKISERQLKGRVVDSQTG